MISDQERKARDFACEAHAKQLYGDLPYSHHLAAVRQILWDAGYGDIFLTAAWLHDWYEDVEGADLRVLEQEFGADVALLVFAVSGVGKNRKERNASAYAKIRLIQKAAILKLADRIANGEHSRQSADQSKFKMYLKELPGFLELMKDAGVEDYTLLSRLKAAFHT
jgi:(p)ppGpp synthase/HD superfamily hydrolase